MTCRPERVLKCQPAGLSGPVPRFQFPLRMPSLTFQTRDGTARTVEITARPLLLGRGDTCDVVLPLDGEVSREHARVWLDADGRVAVQDLKSKNGTRVDAGEPFHGGTHHAARSIRVGEYELTLVGTTPQTAPTSGVSFAADEMPPEEAADSTHYFASNHQLKLDLNQQRLNLLMDLTERIGGAFEPKQLLEQALDACCEALAFERALIVLKTPHGEPELPVTRNVQCDETGAYKVSRTLINRALVAGERAVVNNPATDLLNNLTDSLVRFPICSALCVPIRHRDRILGVMYGDRITRGARQTPYTAEDVDFFAAIAQQVGVGLENVRLFQAYLESEKLKLELEQARAIQRQLLPAGSLRLGQLTLAGHNEPCDEVGGDYFDYFDLGDDRAGLVIADVTGHGLPAALMMANFQAAVRVALTRDVPLPDVASRLNRLACSNTGPNVFITAVLARADTRTGDVTLINAGHPAPLCLRGPRLDLVNDGVSLPFGIDPHERYEVQHLAAGRDRTVVLFYTDGLTEATDARGELLKVAPVAQTLVAMSEPGADAVMRTMLELVRRHRGTAKNLDDLTLAVLQYEPPAEHAG